MKTLITILFIVFYTIVSFADTHYSSGSGNWSTQSWKNSCGGAIIGTAPIAGDFVVICPSHAIVVDVAVATLLGGITIQNGASLTISNANIATANFINIANNGFITIDEGGTFNLQGRSSLKLHNVSMGTGSTLTVNGTLNMVDGFSDIYVGAGSFFNIGSGGSFTWNPATSDMTLFTNTTENFYSAGSPYSSVIIKNWFDAATPFAQNISGNFGNIEFQVGWDQKGQFAPSKIKGLLTVKAMLILDGTSTTTDRNITTGPILVTGLGSLVFEQGSNRNVNITINGDFTDNSTSSNVTAFMYNSFGILNVVNNGNVSFAHDFSAINSTGVALNSTVIWTINGNLTIDGNGTIYDRFDILFGFASTNSSVSLDVNGITSIQYTTNYPTWVHFIDGGTGNLIFETDYLSFNIPSSDYNFNTGSGSTTITVGYDFTLSNPTAVSGRTYILNNASNTNTVTLNIGRDLIMNSQYVELAVAYSNGPVDINIGGNVNFTGGDFWAQRYSNNSSLTTIDIGGNFTYNNTSAGSSFQGTLGDGNIIFTTSGDFNITSTNTAGEGVCLIYDVDGIYNGTGSSTFSCNNFNLYNGVFWGNFRNNGNFTFTTNVFNMDNGFFRGIHNDGIGIYGAGIATFNAGSVDFDGGTFNLNRGCNNSISQANVFNVTGNCDLYFTTSTTFLLVPLYKLGTETNMMASSLTIGGNFIIDGSVDGIFQTCGGSGNETNNISGNFIVNRGTAYFNVSPESAITPNNGHTTTTSIGGNMELNGGAVYLSSEIGTLNAEINGSLSLSNASLYLKTGDGTALTDGSAIVNVKGGFNQLSGNIYFHYETVLTDATSDIVTFTINSDDDSNGDFSQTGGTINFDYNTSSVATHVLNVKSPNCIFGGTGTMTHSSAGTGSVFGQLNFSRNGITIFNRSSATHDIQQIKIGVKDGCILNASSSANGIQISSNNNVAVSGNMLTVGDGISGILDLGTITIAGKSVNDYFSGLAINAGSIVRIANSNGFYNGTQAASLAAKVYVSSVNYRMDYNINSNSTLEYYGAANQIVTGNFPNGASVSEIETGTLAQYKYGILNINNQGTYGVNYAYLSGNNVFVRTRLDLTNGEFRLSDGGSVNGYTVTVENGSNGAITSTANGYLKSECVNASNINTSQIDWQNILASTSTYSIPFGKYTSSIKKISVEFTPSGSPNINSLKSSTRATAVNDNSPWSGISDGGAVSAVNNMNLIGGLAGAECCVIDRWWDFTINNANTTLLAGGATVSFSYLGEENTMTTSPTGEIGVQHWNGTGWDDGKGTINLATGTGSNGDQTTGNINTVTASGLTNFSPYILVAKSSPLPIELKDFNATCNGDLVSIKWSTFSEVNNDYFILEKSFDGNNYQTLEMIKGVGNSQVENEYLFSDKAYNNSDIYYRLKQVDFNGSQEEFNSISVSCSEINKNVFVNYDKLDDKISIIINSNIQSNYNIYLIDNTGRVLWFDKINVKNQQYNVPTKELKKGVYCIIISNQMNVYSERIIIY